MAAVKEIFQVFTVKAMIMADVSKARFCEFHSVKSSNLVDHIL